MADTANTTMIRVRRDAQALVRDIGEQLAAPSLTDLASALIRLGARHAAEDIAAELAALPATGADRGPDGVFRKATPGSGPPVTDLLLRARSLRCLAAAGIRTVDDLVLRTPRDLLRVQRFGQTSLDDVRAALAARKLYLATDEPVVDDAEKNHPSP